MKGLPDDEVGAYVTRMLSGDAYRKLLKERFFQGTLTVVTPQSGNTFLVQLRRTNDAASDGSSYWCAVPGYWPRVGDLVQCVWLESNIGIVIGPLRLAFTAPVKVAEILVGTTAGYLAATNKLSFALPQGGPRRHAVLELQGRSDRAANTLDECGLQFNADTGANYAYSRFNQSGATNTGQESGVTGQTSGRNWWTAGATALAGAGGFARIWIPNYAGAVFKKSARIDIAWFNAAAFLTAGQLQNDYVTIFWNNAAPITQIDVLTLNGNWIVGTLATLSLE